MSTLPLKSTSPRPTLQQRNAAIIAMFDGGKNPMEIGQIYGLQSKTVALILRQHNRQTRSMTIAPKILDRPYEVKNNLQQRSENIDANRDYLRAVFSFHARRGTMPPGMHITDFYKRLDQYQIQIPADLHEIAL
ncbi:hypothetical protein AB1K62_00450 [Parasphingorhabdus sp. JC815]|uniref:hypothetical protein n=1 Tax=Parasphingorhabdus sp. JC815 TaxID=3232140 RepID=UPI003459893E